MFADPPPFRRADSFNQPNFFGEHNYFRDAIQPNRATMSNRFDVDRMHLSSTDFDSKEENYLRGTEYDIFCRVEQSLPHQISLQSPLLPPMLSSSTDEVIPSLMMTQQSNDGFIICTT